MLEGKWYHVFYLSNGCDKQVILHSPQSIGKRSDINPQSAGDCLLWASGLAVQQV